ncbi:alpha/beta hydrolase [Kutzneria kofuensis]|uniref:Acetyl esterase/lipase n=1 Tax=Kutzneria kofuensis TaxID=103725 RepID=A0A7W9KEH6_9PSEU|nr:alpha/beta hydrolase [Kutzneria kofuensis]MBB5891056.1 acetyl esterase/lipase [Kutzneria kofuensis]
MTPEMERAHATLRELVDARSVGTVEAQRQAYVEWAGQFPVPAETVVEPWEFGVWVRTPESEPDRVVLYLHGGAYRLGSPGTHRALMAGVASAARAEVAFADYPLAPEHPFPAAVDFARDAYVSLLDRFAANRIAIAGESAGGGLAVALLLRLRDEGLPLPAAAAVNSPWVDLECTGESMATRASRDPMLSRAGLLAAATEYLAGKASPLHPYASPIYGDLTGLPPLLVQVGTEEILHDDAVALAARAGARLIVVQDAPHVWHYFTSWLPEARDAVRAMGEHILAATR